MLGIKDVWSAIRSMVVSRLSAIIESFSLEQLECFFDELVQVGGVIYSGKFFIPVLSMDGMEKVHINLLCFPDKLFCISPPEGCNYTPGRKSDNDGN